MILSAARLSSCLLAGLALSGVWLAGACTSRTLPLPPPIVQSLSAPDAEGMVRVRGLAHEGASVGVMNEATQEGVLTSSPEIHCGSSCPFEVRIAAEAGDPLRVWQFFETESSTYGVVPDR